MNQLISSLSGSGAQSDPHYSENLTQIEKVLENLEPKRAKLVAATALLLGRVAFADHEISEGEREVMKQVLEKDLGLDASLAEVVSDLAVERTLVERAENHLVVRQLNEVASRSEKIGVLRALFAVATDEDISEVESSEIQFLAKSLGFPHSDYVALRSEFREHLAVLKGRS